MFDNIRAITQDLANEHSKTANGLTKGVLPILTNLHTEIKQKNKELEKGAGKGSKMVDKARHATTKEIELFGQNVNSYNSTGGKISAAEDPYVAQRSVRHLLNRQVQEENNNRHDLIAVQDSFASFEAHVLQTFQSAIAQLAQVLSNQGELNRGHYARMVGTANGVQLSHEWEGFIQRNNGVLIDPKGPLRSVDSINFAFQNHESTQPVVAGILQRKGKLLKKYEPGYYVVTKAKYLHEFKSDDDFAKEPSPENSLYLPDCMVGALDVTKFNIKGKDVSKGSLGNKFSMSHEYQFQANTPDEAQKWYNVIRESAGQTTTDRPTTPIDDDARLGETSAIGGAGLATTAQGGSAPHAVPNTYPAGSSTIDPHYPATQGDVTGSGVSAVGSTTDPALVGRQSTVAGLSSTTGAGLSTTSGTGLSTTSGAGTVGGLNSGLNHQPGGAGTGLSGNRY